MKPFPLVLSMVGWFLGTCGEYTDLEGMYFINGFNSDMPWKAIAPANTIYLSGTNEYGRYFNSYQWSLNPLGNDEYHIMKHGGSMALGFGPGLCDENTALKSRRADEATRFKFFKSNLKTDDDKYGYVLKPVECEGIYVMAVNGVKSMSRIVLKGDWETAKNSISHTFIFNPVTGNPRNDDHLKVKTYSHSRTSTQWNIKTGIIDGWTKENGVCALLPGQPTGCRLDPYGAQNQAWDFFVPKETTCEFSCQLKDPPVTTINLDGIYLIGSYDADLFLHAKDGIKLNRVMMKHGGYNYNRFLSSGQWMIKSTGVDNIFNIGTYAVGMSSGLWFSARCERDAPVLLTKTPTDFEFVQSKVGAGVYRIRPAGCEEWVGAQSRDWSTMRVKGNENWSQQSPGWNWRVQAAGGNPLSSGFQESGTMHTKKGNGRTDYTRQTQVFDGYINPQATCELEPETQPGGSIAGNGEGRWTFSFAKDKDYTFRCKVTPTEPPTVPPTTEPPTVPPTSPPTTEPPTVPPTSPPTTEPPTTEPPTKPETYAECVEREGMARTCGDNNECGCEGQKCVEMFNTRFCAACQDFSSLEGCLDMDGCEWDEGKQECSQGETYMECVDREGMGKMCTEHTDCGCKNQKCANMWNSRFCTACIDFTSEFGCNDFVEGKCVWADGKCTSPPPAPATDPPTTEPPTAPPTAPPTTEPPTAPPTAPPTTEPPTKPPTAPPTVDPCLGLVGRQCKKATACEWNGTSCGTYVEPEDPCTGLVGRLCKKNKACGWNGTSCGPYVEPKDKCDGLDKRPCKGEEGCILKNDVCILDDGSAPASKKDCKKAAKKGVAECEKLGCKVTVKQKEGKPDKVKCKPAKN